MPRKKASPVSKKARHDLSTKPKATVRKKAAAKKVVKSRVPKTRNANTWSEAEFWQMIRSALRNKSRFWKPRLKCLEAARRPSQSANRRLKWEFMCAHCFDWFPQTAVEAHHSCQAGSLKAGSDLEGFVSRLFAEDGWICLCKGCHKNEHNSKD